MTSPLAPVSSSRSSLLRPLDERAILVQNEQVYYAERQHWASVVRPVYETFVFLLSVVWAVDVFGSPGRQNSWVGLVLLAAAVHALIFIASGASPMARLAVDPFANTDEHSLGKVKLIGAAALVALAIYLFGFRPVGIVAVVIVISRLVIILARWSFYERRYITNRRVIESGGFLGSRISSMPLSRVTDISYSRTIPGELFGYATMRVETAGQDQALGIVRYIAEPDHFYEVLINFSAPRTINGS
jgi:membrane protein YdbS with pleckstrin-like domain